MLIILTGKLMTLVSQLLLSCIFNLVSLDNGAKMSPKRQTLLSLVFACICLSKSLLIRIIISHLKGSMARFIPLLYNAICIS